jgi:hypothetical protein
MRITGRKYSFNRRSMSTVSRYVASTVEIQTKISEQPALHRTSESHCKQYEIRVELERGIWKLSKARVQFHCMYSLNSAVIT